MKNRMAIYCHIIYCYLKVIVAYFYLHVFKRSILHQGIWVVREKRTEARDNGYHFFKYISTKYPNLNAYYIITYDSPDFQKVSSLGRTIKADSFRHYVYWLASEFSIGSQPYGAVPDPSEVLYRLKILCNKKQKVIHLKHGICKDEVSHTLDYQLTRFDVLCCAAKREREFIHNTYGYPYSNVLLTGFCRFDNLPLNGKPLKQILIMPTFRNWLAAKNREKEASDSEKEVFIQSSFYNNYSKVLTDARLLEVLRNTGYKVVFYMHFSLQSYVECFKKLGSDYIIIADRVRYDVQKLLVDSCILVTDYSSVFFDFAYMGKPEVFFQFDEEEYRNKHYKKGYFDYRTDGFGPVIQDEVLLVDRLIEYINNNSKIDKMYMDRVNSFFEFRDNRNCERVYNAIICSNNSKGYKLL